MYNYLEHTNLIKHHIPDFSSEDMVFVHIDTITASSKIQFLSIENILMGVYPRMIVKKLIYLTVEIVQNIIKHKDTLSPIDQSVFFITQKDKTVYIVSGNIISKYNYNRLVDRITFINSLSEEKLEEYRMKVFRNDGFTEKGGAGLGLIEMRRKTSEKIKHFKTEIDGNYSYIYTILTYNLPNV